MMAPTLDELDELDSPCAFCDELLRDCKCLDAEPDCTCTQTDVDQFDARGCELCDPRSTWNEQQRREAAFYAWRAETMERNAEGREPEPEPKPVRRETRVTEEAA